MKWFEGWFSRGEQAGSWVREVEHTVLRLISLGFSLGSALGIHWFLEPFDVLGPLHLVMGWVIAVCFGVGGYFLSRGVAHRLMNGESVWLYLPFFVVVEFVEIFCNFALSVSIFGRAAWLEAVPGDWRRGVMMFLAYVVLSIIPLASASLAVSDMDMERKCQAGRSSGSPGLQSWSGGSSRKGPSGRGATASQTGYSQGYGGGGSDPYGAWNNREKARAKGEVPLAGAKTEMLVP